MAHAFIDRLAAAIDHLHDKHLAQLKRDHPHASGPNAVIAAACGMGSQSVLSDILAGRIPGTKYRARLAEILRVDADWLSGTGGEPPDWALPSVTAWRRFEVRLQKASNAAAEDISANAKPHQFQESMARMYAAKYRLDQRTPLPLALAKGHYALLPFDLVLRHAEQCGMAIPDHVDHLRDGHVLWAAMRAEVEEDIQAERRRCLRVVPPPLLFAVIREALKDRIDTAQSDDRRDAIEVLWRQQWLATGKSRREFPAELAQDTGRKTWSVLETIRKRWE